MNTEAAPRDSALDAWENPDTALFGILLVLSTLFFFLMRATSPAGSAGDPFDSPLFGWSWLILPLLATGACYVRPRGSRPLLWSVALMAPLMIGVAVIGTVLHDPDHGASLWAVGEMFLVMEGAVTLAAARAASKRSRA